MADQGLSFPFPTVKGLGAQLPILVEHYIQISTRVKLIQTY